MHCGTHFRFGKLFRGRGLHSGRLLEGVHEYDVYAVYRQSFCKLLFKLGDGLIVRQRLAHFKFAKHCQFNRHSLLECLKVSLNNSDLVYLRFFWLLAGLLGGLFCLVVKTIVLCIQELWAVVFYFVRCLVIWAEHAQAAPKLMAESKLFKEDTHVRIVVLGEVCTIV